MVRGIVYLAGGVLAGAALSENKELVTDVLLSTGNFMKMLSRELLQLEFQGKRMNEVPVVKNVLLYFSSLNIEREYLNDGVTKARGFVRDVVGKQDRIAMEQQGGGAGGAGGGVLATTVKLSIPAAIAAFLYWDKPAREWVWAKTLRAYEEVRRRFENLPTVVGDKKYQEAVQRRLTQDLEELNRCIQSWGGGGWEVVQEEVSKRSVIAVRHLRTWTRDVARKVHGIVVSRFPPGEGKPAVA
ncbi:hypothetical protein GUITHDRAFT_155185 [Guillardia theta CCMP2712]|uniref:Uncharacterized protein n=2 Tax=Guillardia theta TaxID=55529 RepID=L1IK72_GUITC|nr:hypothetical protein GUITHDRAFT_155185 [Guillardia theta CCMP2712]EKX36648.1 hypothetical protein GUITHDRAFT_155185 [Guillardia theta CCMP2712]|mmetsp:Transcript_41759/g.131672  ORF Transcript_41759/g.131672 Transcript_41759/m.131672 type:complete len:242 (+) Transcript_41759:452-1177(+)|eukprot:XP_005823628.1 hypothetical protein GUITHDRAFT_155185 [Guillardia theta CCMP2712]